ncbi:MAG: DUF4212 domain-containing protein [Bacillaceae bacterium]|uniref:DUF4212 domain-containing protein n=1 Tax=Alkalihalobacterium chitinilyticum TaxID=2980103 RepID=A0ABT5VGZ7_9BACI|nr:DUF4212 domain-containing protein [Alkalihalobacterium chitinilyticum]MDE5414723.1 DUF4212 domain-containing protein [Alkalihalobacterium chitinilyticum]MEB1807489.1 DUF4212 domain-containing protein [Bacillaceae bacterium]
MKKIDKSVADAYFKARNTVVIICLIIGGLASFGIVAFAESLVDVTFMGMPFHYYMGAQGAVATFVILLFVNAVISDRIDKKFGIDEEQNTRIGAGKALDH